MSKHAAMLEHHPKHRPSKPMTLGDMLGWAMGAWGTERRGGNLRLVLGDAI